jgi:8-oxo-dGTP pyrophosphatase MutT (NUDIX family)
VYRIDFAGIFTLEYVMLTAIRKRLTGYVPRKIPCDPSVRAATALLVFEHEGAVSCVLTKRTDTVRHHKGEVSFPGGMFEPGDGNLEYTALRESHEEVGVRPQDVEIIGRLDDSWTYTGFVISTFVGVIPYPYDFTTNPGEVAHLIFLPYKHLKGSELAPEQWGELHYNGDRIWGATCRILLTFRDVVENETI